MAQERYRVLARKWRPQRFEDVVGQEHITRTLQNSIKNGRIGHAFLFIGTRGVGKTTTARILARALNCVAADGPTPEPCGECPNCTSIATGTNIDVVEIDGASNNSVDHVREIRENIRMVPSSSRYKIYIIDEVHQLSQSAFNALLKTLEEPPEHALFVLATTEAHKVPATIISRCQRYDFRRVGRERLSELLRHILDKEGVACTDEALLAIARAADGSVRDGESILDQLISYCGNSIEFEDVFDCLGLVDWQVMHDLCDAILDKNIAKQLQTVEDVTVSGKDLSQFVQDILRYFRNLLVCKTADAKSLIALPDEELAAMEQRAARFSLTNLIRMVEQFAELSKDFDSQLAQRIALESLLIRLSKLGVEVSVDTVLEKLAALGAGGIAEPVLSPNDSAGTSPEAAPCVAREEPPVNPSQAAGQPPAAEPAQPSTPPSHESKRVTLDEHNMAELWETMAHAVSQEDLHFGLTLGHARPVALSEGTLVLKMGAHHEREAQNLRAGVQAERVQAALQAHTENVKAFRIELEEAEAPAPSNGNRERNANFGPRVKPEEAQQVMELPGVAEVLDVFKGNIVDIRRQPPQA